MKLFAWLWISVLAPMWVASAAGTNHFAFGDYFLVPVRIHLLSAPEKPRLTTTLTSLDISRILGKANGIWEPAGIQFYLESLVKETATEPALHEENRKLKQFRWLMRLCPPETRAENLFNIYYIKEMSVNGIYLRDAIFVQDEAVLSTVPGGIGEPLPRVTAHELGHALSLEHRQNVTNLMASGTTGIALNDAEILQARTAAAALPWIENADAIMKKADLLREAGKSAEARALYQRITRLPIKAPEVEAARARGK